MLIATSQEGIVGCLRALNLTSLQIVDPPMALIFMGFSDGLPGFNRLVSGGVVGSHLASAESNLSAPSERR